MNIIGHYGQNWTLWTKLNSTDKIEWTKLNGQNWTMWTKLDTMDKNSYRPYPYPEKQS